MENRISDANDNWPCFTWTFRYEPSARNRLCIESRCTRERPQEFHVTSDRAVFLGNKGPLEAMQTVSNFSD
ncbi:MAG: hypothetical protein CMJ70_24660 [Planctomycetaceae bacterium]|nr:hypothetical protein [Planctomycetaceae bacterium]